VDRARSWGGEVPCVLHQRETIIRHTFQNVIFKHNVLGSSINVLGSSIKILTSAILFLLGA